jgi:hypothetical protein
VKFYYIYKALAHPALYGYVTPLTLEERLMHVQEAKRRLGSQIPWICDTMSNDLKHALGDASNPEFIFDPDGKLVSKRWWSNPEKLREDLVKLVGPVENPTRVEDLDMKALPPREAAAKGVLPRLEVPMGLQALKVEPVISEKGAPFYVKLRAEADRDVLHGEAGELYLGFYLDPVYAVHWNNLVAPLRFELELPDGAVASQTKGDAPKVEVEADSDPREFLIDLDPDPTDAPIQATVFYFACDDAETFCIPVTQQYQIYLEVDPDGGRRRTGWTDRGPASFAERLSSSDVNGDGLVSRDELPERLGRLFERIDENGDGFIDAKERERMESRFGGMASEGFVQRLLERDQDGDGCVRREELPEEMRRRFDRMDSNHDGCIDAVELEEMAERIERFRGEPPPER